MLQRDPDQLVLDVYASGRQNLLRDELVIAKTIDFLVEHATAVSPKPTDAAAAKAAGEKPASKGGKAGKAEKVAKTAKAAKTAKVAKAAKADEAEQADEARQADEADEA
jgi:hypothetical protein